MEGEEGVREGSKGGKEMIKDRQMSKPGGWCGHQENWGKVCSSAYFGGKAYFNKMDNLCIITDKLYTIKKKKVEAEKERRKKTEEKEDLLKTQKSRNV